MNRADVVLSVPSESFNVRGGQRGKLSQPSRVEHPHDLQWAAFDQKILTTTVIFAQKESKIYSCDCIIWYTKTTMKWLQNLIVVSLLGDRVILSIFNWVSNLCFRMLGTVHIDEAV